MSNKRLHFIDNLRILLTILVIVFHLAITYGSPIGDWQYKEGNSGILEGIFYTAFISISQSFSMGFFFFISGYFTPGSYDRKGANTFLRDRIVRLGVPLVFYIIIIDPIISFILALNNGFSGSFMEFLENYIVGYKGLASGPLWFLEALMIFALGYVIIRKLGMSPSLEINFPENIVISLFAFVLGMASFIVRIWFPLGYNFKLLNLQIPFFSQYIALFALGVLAFRHNWLTKISVSAGRLWSRIAVGLIALFPLLLLLLAQQGDTTRLAGGLHWQAFILSMWEQFTCISIIISLNKLFYEKFNNQSILTKTMSEVTYTTYIIHAPIIILIAIMLKGVQLPLLLKWVFVSWLAVPVCFAVSYYIKKLPVLQSIL